MTTPTKIEDPRLVLAREMVHMLRDICEPVPEESEPGKPLYEGMVSCDVLDLAKGAALLIQATTPTVPASQPTDQGDNS